MRSHRLSPLCCRSVYVFFNLRESDELITPTWLGQQLLMQIVVFLRQSGTSDALIERGQVTLHRWMYKLRLVDSRFTVVTDELADPVYTLQSIARKAIQYDIAQLTSLILVPTVISFFIWRDGVFTLEGTGILVDACNLERIWLRFLVLLCLWPVGSSSGRCLLVHRMNKTLLGQRTLHGTSQTIVKMINNARIARMDRAKVKAQRKAAAEAKRAKAAGSGSKVELAEESSVGGVRLDLKTETKQQESLDLTEEERAAVGDELLVSVLNFRLLFVKQLRHVRFFTLVVLLQLFVTFRVRTTALKAGVANPAVSVIGNASSLVNGTLSAVAAARNGRQRKAAPGVPINDDWYVLPPQSVWIFVNPVDKRLYDASLVAAIDGLSKCASNHTAGTTADIDGVGGGWVIDLMIHSTVRTALGVAIALAVICATSSYLFLQIRPGLLAHSAQRRKSTLTTKRSPSV